MCMMINRCASKAKFAHLRRVQPDRVPRIIPNAVVRSKGDNATYIGHELAKCRDYTSIRYRLPFEKVGS